MILNVIQYIIDDVKEETKTEAKAEFVSIIRKKMEKGYEASAISDFLESPLSDVESICDLIRANPDDTDLQIAKKHWSLKQSGTCDSYDTQQQGILPGKNHNGECQ